jgi:hypothetical protein
MLGYVRFEALMTMNVKRTVFWDVTPCGLGKVYRRFRGPHCFSLQGQGISRARKHARTLLSNKLRNIVYMDISLKMASYMSKHVVAM